MGQLNFILRYVRTDKEIIDSLFGFVPIKSHRAEYLKGVILKKFSYVVLDKTKTVEGYVMTMLRPCQ